MSDSPAQTNKKKRASRRYPYPRAAVCKYADQALEIQLLNISTSGIQFAARTKIETKEAIKINWRDANFGLFEPTFLIAREIHKPENKEYSYYYGAQYYNLIGPTKQNLLHLLKSFKDEESKEIEHEVQKITPMFLMDVLEQGGSFLQTAFEGKALPYFNPMIAEIKDYEKESFKDTSLVSKAIQRLVIHNFHCVMIKTLVPIMVDHVELLSAYFEKTRNELNEIRDTEDLVESELKKIVEGTADEAKRKTLQQHLNESSNRLFYAKQDCLQSVVAAFSEEVKSSEQLSPIFMDIKAEFEKMSVSNASFQEEVKLYTRKTKKPEEFSKVEAITDIAPLEDKKPGAIIYLGVLFLVISGAFFAYFKIEHMMKQKDLNSDIGLQTKIINYGRMGTQIDLTLDDGWSQLDYPHQLEEFKKIVVFLKKDRQATSALLFDSRHGIIQVLYEDRDPRIENLPSATTPLPIEPAASPTEPAPSPPASPETTTPQGNS